MAEIVTPGSANANSYVSVVEADAYHANHLYAAAWTAASPAQKEAAVIMATRLLDEHVPWSGAAVDAVQALCWPRTGMSGRTGFAVPTTTIPQALKDAAAELARRLLEADLTETNEVASRGITSIKAGSVALEFKAASIRNMDPIDFAGELARGVLPDAVLAKLPSSWLSPLKHYPVFKMV